MALIILPRRDNYANFIESNFIPKHGELTVCYEENGRRFYKIGDGKSNISDLPEVDLNTVNSFNLYIDSVSDKPITTVYLDPRKYEEEMRDRERHPTYEVD